MDSLGGDIGSVLSEVYRACRVDKVVRLDGGY